MKTLEKLLTIFIAVTLALSVVSVANPSFFVGSGLSAYAINGNGEENSEHSGSEEEEVQYQETEQEKLEQEIRENSEVELELDEETEVEVEIQEADLADGQYTITFMCADPEFSETFPNTLEVVNGEGQLEYDLALAPGTYSGCILSTTGLSVSFPVFTIVEEEHDDEEEEAEETEEEEQSEEEQEEEVEEEHQEEESDVTEEDAAEENEVIGEDLGENSEVEFQPEEEGAEVEVDIEEGDLPDGMHTVTFGCSSPEFSFTFAKKLNVEGGNGDFEADLMLPAGTYSGCIMSVASLSVKLPDFIIATEEEEENDEEENGEEEEHEEEQDVVDEEQESKIKWELEDTGIEMQVDLKGITMADGMYDVVFSCTEPVVNETFAGGFEVKDGEGKFETKLSLPNGTYNGCQLTIQDETIIQFDSFNVVGEVEEEVEEKRKEKGHAMVNSMTGTDIHQRHLNAQPASTGDYQPGWGYRVVAAGIAEDDEDNLANAAVDIDLAVWKSNRAVILLDVLGGQIEIGDHSYTVAIGYALYGIHSDMLRINALVIDDATGDIMKMKMRGSAIAEDADFPTDTGSLELEFEGNSGPLKNEVDGWELMLDGTVAAA